LFSELRADFRELVQCLADDLELALDRRLQQLIGLVVGK